MMAEIKYKVCDVTGQRKNVTRFAIRLWQLEDGEADPSELDGDIVFETKDLSPKIVERLKAAIDRVLTKPGAKVLIENK